MSHWARAAQLVGVPTAHNKQRLLSNEAAAAASHITASHITSRSSGWDQDKEAAGKGWAAGAVPATSHTGVGGWVRGRDGRDSRDLEDATWTRLCQAAPPPLSLAHCWCLPLTRRVPLLRGAAVGFAEHGRCEALQPARAMVLGSLPRRTSFPIRHSYALLALPEQLSPRGHL